MDCVDDNERFSRWVFYPRFMDENGGLNHKFIFLRPNINEEGISGQLYDRISRQIAIEDGVKFCRKKNGKPRNFRSFCSPKATTYTESSGVAASIIARGLHTSKADQISICIMRICLTQCRL